MRLLTLAALATAAIAACAQVQLPHFFTDSMVVQHDAILTIPGTARRGSTVKVTPSWTGIPVKAKADKQGRFTAQIQTPPCGGPHNITIDDGKKKTVLNDIWSGEVWLCSGQSNMEMPVEGWGKVYDYRRVVEEAGDPMLRLLQVKKQTAYGPQTDTEVSMGGWRTASPHTVADFSAIGYFYGSLLSDELGVPIGIIDCTWGGTPIESWMAYSALSGMDEFPAELATLADNNFDSTGLIDAYNAEMVAWNEWAKPEEADFDVSTMQDGWASMPAPANWENTVLPNFDGVVWMQRQVYVDPADSCKPAVLSLAKIDDRDITYVNGVKVGEASIYNLDRIYDVPEGVLRAGDNTITIRVTDTNGSGGIYGQPQDMTLTTSSGTAIRLDGEWKYKVAKDYSERPRPASPTNPNFPTVLYNAMLHPLQCMPVKGVLWYQGCSNVGRDQQYARLFPAMIEAWRDDWNQPDMPFYFVQLAAYLQPQRVQPDSQWAALRQAQASALSLPGVEMAVAIDIGDPNDIHPKNKQEVARRLANIALANSYGRKTVWLAPRVVSAERNGRHVLLTFDQFVNLPANGQGFILRGPDGQWARGFAVQHGTDAIEVSSDQIDTPAEVRYDWADYPDGELTGPGMLPVAPFAVIVE